MGEAWSDMWAWLGTDAAWHGKNGLPELLWAHVKLSLASMLVAGLVALPPAIVLGHVKRGALLAVSIVNIGRAVPSFAIVALLLPFSLRWGFGLGFWPTLVALVLLAVPPIFTNTYTGVRDVPAEAVEAAQGMGMRPAEVLRRVEVPVALPLILTGLRVSMLQVVATATLGALVGYQCLGTHIVSGFYKSDKGALLASAFVVMALALVLDALFAVAQRLLVPWRSRSGRDADVTVAAEEIVPSGA
jgi:osmoprotectant transport system permease protein